MPSLPASTPGPMRLLQILGGAGSPQAGVTGVERVVQSLIAGLDRRRFEHYLAYPETGELLSQVEGGVRAVLGRLPAKRFDRQWMDDLASFMGAHRIQVVVTHGWRADFLTTLTCRRLRKPHLVARAAPLADEATMGSLRKLAYGLVDTWTLHACAGIITVSETSKDRMRATQRLAADRFTVIPNGVPVPRVSQAERDAARRRLGLAPADRVIGAAGRLVAGKGFHVLLEAMARLRQLDPDPGVRGVILGEGPERRNLERQAAARGLNLLLPGYVRDPLPLMATFDIAVLPSRAEGMPLFLLEAMALGIATVATPVGGCREILTPEETGLFVPVGDATALALALGRLLRDPDARRRLGDAAARTVHSRYTLEAMVQGYDACLTRTVSRWYGREQERLPG